ncbi:MAG: electron transport complex subunit RsxC [Gammaproteobacteria bacterium]|nr:electron transport complex subunit RsxC [Gammaproteobacteria bacterium]
MNWPRLFGFQGGIHPGYHKDRTSNRAVKRLPFPLRLILPLDQHIGAPALPIVRPGQEVIRGELIAKADGFVSAPIHAPATGVVKSIELKPTARGSLTNSIVIEVLRGDPQEVMISEPHDIDNMDHDELVNAIQDSGLAGLGGAAFPSHVKLKQLDGKQAELLLVNGCECEPYLTTDHRVMLEQPDDLIQGIKYALRATGTQRAIIGIEDNKLDAVEVIRKHLLADDPIEVRTVVTRYPQGAEKLLVKSLMDREVPEGGLPLDVGVIIHNVGTLAQMGKLLSAGEGLIERVVTITGTGVDKPGNYRIPLGTPIGFVLDTLGIDATKETIILGGPMMGPAVGSLEAPVTKGTSGILVFHERDFIDREHEKVYPCIKCGRCVDACPMRLNPAQLGWLAANREYQIMQDEYHLNNCFECGCCSYSCPSRIPLVQYFRIAKATNREQVIKLQKQKAETASGA